MGFYAAVAAASSQAAALRAWEFASYLFAEGLASEVKDDPDLLAEASRTPGEILKKPRGDPKALLAMPTPKRAAKPPIPKAAAREKAPPATSRAEPKPPSGPKPALDRRKLDAALAELSGAKPRLADRLLAIKAERKALDAEEAQARRDGAATVAKAQAAVDRDRRALNR